MLSFLGSFSSNLLLPALDGVQQFLGIGVVGKVISNWLQKFVDCFGHGRLDISRMHLAFSVSFFKLLVRFEQLGSSILLSPVHGKGVESREDDRFAVVKNGVFKGNLRGTVSFLNLAIHIFDGIFHENGRVRVGFAHFSLALFETQEHVV